MINTDLIINAQGFILDIGSVPREVLNRRIFDPEVFISHTSPLSTYLELHKVIASLETEAVEQT